MLKMHFYSQWGFSVSEAKLWFCMEQVICRQQEKMRSVKIVIRFEKNFFNGSSWSELQHEGLMLVELLRDLCGR